MLQWKNKKLMTDLDMTLLFQQKEIEINFPVLNLCGHVNIDLWVYKSHLNAPWSPCQRKKKEIK